MKKILVSVDLLKYYEEFNIPYNNYNGRNNYILS